MSELNVTGGARPPTFWIEVPGHAVPPAQRRVASAALAYAVRDLALPPQHVRWYALAEPPWEPTGAVFATRGLRDRAGICLSRGDDLWVRLGHDREATATTVLHEAWHRRDYLDTGGTKRADDEPRAHAYTAAHRGLIREMGRPGWPQRTKVR